MPVTTGSTTVSWVSVFTPMTNHGCQDASHARSANHDGLQATRFVRTTADGHRPQPQGWDANWLVHHEPPPMRQKSNMTMSLLLVSRQTSMAVSSDRTARKLSLEKTNSRQLSAPAVPKPQPNSERMWTSVLAVHLDQATKPMMRLHRCLRPLPSQALGKGIPPNPVPGEAVDQTEISAFAAPTVKKAQAPNTPTIGRTSTSVVLCALFAQTVSVTFV